MKYDIIDNLEGRYVPNPRGEYFIVQNRQHCLPEGKFSLRLFETGQLEAMLRKSMSVAEYDTLRHNLLNEEQIMDKDTQEADKWFRELSPKAQKQVIKRAYQQWYTDQQIALAMAEGSY